MSRLSGGIMTSPSWYLDQFNTHQILLIRENKYIAHQRCSSTSFISHAFNDSLKVDLKMIWWREKGLKLNYVIITIPAISAVWKNICSSPWQFWLWTLLAIETVPNPISLHWQGYIKKNQDLISIIKLKNTFKSRTWWQCSWYTSMSGLLSYTFTVPAFFINVI